MKKKSNKEHGFIIIESSEAVEVEDKLGNLADLIIRIMTRLEKEDSQAFEGLIEKSHGE